MSTNDILNATDSKGSLMLEGHSADDKYALISFIGKGKGKQLARISRSYQALGSTIMLGRGAARSEILEYLGLELDQKEIVISHVQADWAQAALQALRNKLEMDRPGHGIAFLIPILSSKGLKAIFRLAEKVDQRNPETVEKPNPLQVSDEGIIFAQHDLIVAVLQESIVETAMDWARAAGAAGGTIIYGHSWRADAKEEVLGIAGESAKEILLMLVRKNRTRPILESLCHKLKSNGIAGSLIVSLPVSAVIGLTHRLVVLEDGSITEQTYHHA